MSGVLFVVTIGLVGFFVFKVLQDARASERLVRAPIRVQNNRRERRQ